jgi:hypothetical protein
LFIAGAAEAVTLEPFAIEPPSRRMRKISFNFAPPFLESKNQPIQTSLSDEGQQNQYVLPPVFGLMLKYPTSPGKSLAPLGGGGRDSFDSFLYISEL